MSRYELWRLSVGIERGYRGWIQILQYLGEAEGVATASSPREHVQRGIVPLTTDGSRVGKSVEVEELIEQVRGVVHDRPAEEGFAVDTERRDVRPQFGSE